MKQILNIVGTLFVVIGIFWILQGTNIVKTGAMAGQSQWAIIGVVVGLVGIGVLVFGNRRRPK
ncbi:MAG: LPXTG cell wall anchor domain-containing protein [Chloroflexota bacterium]|jgi:LPXTG-motif cell wall-anchored protein|nr:LPXTG cell wall anchor domain-containing protein [Anaerolineae bacterium]MCB0102314.1 LPXTG cell wall anchor domain-containing protein [Anaerolineales bacterium]